MKKLGVAICSFIAPEVHHILKNGDYPDVELISFKGYCLRSKMNENCILKSLKSSCQHVDDIMLIGSSCVQPTYTKEITNLTAVELKQCFELYINREVIEHYTTKGYYIVTSGWLKNYKKQIQEWGFEPDMAKKFFSESLKKIIYLDTQISNDFLPKLQAVSEYMGLPYDTLPVGISHCKNYIDRLINNWRHENEKQSLNAQLVELSKNTADYNLIFNQLRELINYTNEIDIIKSGFTFLNLLFAPSKIEFIDNNNTTTDFTNPFFSNIISVDNSFTIDVFHAQNKAGAFLIKGVAFPQYIDKYKELANPVSHIFGLALANAREYQKTREQSKHLQAYSEQLKVANQTKDRFFSIISHDLKSPFNSLLGFSEILVQSISDQNFKDAAVHAQIINDISNQTFTLLNNLLEWARTQSGHINYAPQRFDLTEIVSDQLEVFHDVAKSKNIRIDNLLPSNIQCVFDKNMLKTVIRNLISNAIKFTPSNGQISISASKADKAMQLTVSDSGVGMSHETVESLFKIDKTQSTLGTNNESGTGLGLILCKEFIEKHNGEIWAESKPQHGSSFCFTLPCNN